VNKEPVSYFILIKNKHLFIMIKELAR